MEVQPNVKMESGNSGNTMETNGNTGNAHGGNTKSPRAVPGRYWCFTYFYENEEELETMETKFRNQNIDYFFGLEECPTTKRKHAQGFIETGYKIRAIETIKIPTIHWEKTKGNREQNIKYCGKSGVIRTNMVFRAELIDPLKDLELKPWQQKLKNIIEKKPGDRTINWIYGTKGSEGKTSFAKSTCINNPKNCLYLGGKSTDVKYAVCSFINDRKNHDLRTVFFDYTRSQENFISYEALESVKNGIFFNSKYESGMCIFNTPHIIVFANFPPETDKLSKDRWNIINITEEEEEEEEELELVDF